MPPSNLRIQDILQTASSRLFPEQLGEAHVSINSVGCDGDTPLHVFIWAGETNNALLLIKSGANINAIGDMGETPLHVAIRNENLAVICSLLSAGADASIVSEFGDSALDLARKHGIDLGAFPKQKDQPDL